MGSDPNPTYTELHRYAGSDYDVSSQLNYMDARYEDRARGRFISEDPVFWGAQNLADPQSLNSYSYANNNPINKSDPTGLKASDDATRSEINKLKGQVRAVAKAFALDLPSSFWKSFLDPIGGYNTARDNSASLSVRTGATIGLVAGVAGTALTPEGRGAQGVLKGAQSPVIQKALQYGRQMHSEFKVAEADGVNFVKEFTFDNRLRADAIDFTTNTIYELKPDNARAITQGYAQLSKYIQQASQQFGGTFRGVLETYTRP